MKSKKGVVAGIIIMFVSLFIALLAYVITTPLLEPFLSGLNTDPVTTFLISFIPYWLFFGIITGVTIGGITT